MARLQSWRDQLPQSYTGPQKWGTGINPVHSKRGGFEGRNLAPPNEVQPATGYVTFDYGETPGDYATTDVDLTFLNYHPNLGEEGHRARTNTVPYAPGNLGRRKRARREGVSYKDGKTDALPRGRAAEGWENKRHGEELTSETSDPAQLIVRTSEVQRTQRKQNGSAVLRGTDDPRAGIGSRQVGMRVKTWAGGHRHDDMLPKQQDYYPRPWRYRGAGTGPVEYLAANAYQPVSPVTRTVPPDVFTGPEESTLITDEGYSEDFGWY